MPRYIDADFLIDKLKEQANIPWNKRAAPVSCSYAYKEFIDDIENAPTADVENGRPQAFWDGEYFDEISEEYRAPCSRCGNEMQSSLHIDGYVKFCPNCGAVMVEAREVQDDNS
jgi:predicted RNA-binding Zn-ribbon protein involved in translation (DUF1610 family)